MTLAAIGRSNIPQQIYRQEGKEADNEADDKCVSLEHIPNSSGLTPGITRPPARTSYMTRFVSRVGCMPLLGVIRSQFINHVLTYDVDERPIPTRPILLEGTRAIPGYVSVDDYRPVVKDIAHTDVNAGVDVLLVDKYSVGDVLNDALPERRGRLGEPFEGNLPR